MSDEGYRSLRTIFDRYPVLKGLWTPRTRIPFVPQLTSSECGLASLAMVLGLYGRATSIDELRKLVTVQPGAGVDAMTLLDVGRMLGLRGRGVSIDIEDLEQLEPGAILHWDFNHFVVFESFEPRAVMVVDPAFGRRRVPAAELRKAFTGVALLFVPTETLEHRARAPRKVWGHLVSLLKLPMWPRIVVSSVLLQLFGLAVPSLTAVVVDRIVPLGDRDLLLVAAAGLSMVGLFHYLALLVRGHLMLSVRRHLGVQLHVGFMDHLVSLPFRFLQERTSGDLLARYGSNSSIQNALTSGTMTVLIDGTMVMLFLLMLMILQPAMGLTVLAFAAVEVLVVAVPFRAQRELANQGLISAGRTLSAASEILQATETLKLLGAEQRAVRGWTNRLVESLKFELEGARISVHQEALLGALRFAAPVTVLGVGASLVVSGSLGLGTMLSAAALAGGFLGPLSSLLSTVLSISNIESHILRINDVLCASPEQPLSPLRAIPKVRGRLEVDDAWFRYGPLSPRVLKGVSLKVEPGQFVALVGPSGSGKSTLAGLLLGLASPERGRIAFDGVELQELDLTALRRQVGVVPQRPFLFNQTVRHNIAAGDGTMDMNTVIEAAKLACIHEEILALPQGYDTELSEGGSSLSGGQRQRIALARALARKPKILVLDEGTSALDAVAERAVQANLENLGCTRIIIAHRLSTVQRADTILVFDDGAIVERGTHEELAQTKGAYARLLMGT